MTGVELGEGGRASSARAHTNTHLLDVWEESCPQLVHVAHNHAAGCGLLLQATGADGQHLFWGGGQ